MKYLTSKWLHLGKMACTFEDQHLDYLSEHVFPIISSILSLFSTPSTTLQARTKKWYY